MAAAAEKPGFPGEKNDAGKGSGESFYIGQIHKEKQPYNYKGSATVYITGGIGHLAEQFFSVFHDLVIIS